MKTKMQHFDGSTLLTKFNGGKTTAKYPDKKAIFS
jgi:CRP/FNR family cyclic AMP-dependent transcriptional regulator